MPYKDKEIRREYDRNWLRLRRESWFAVNNRCVDCGSADNLELDHIDPSTKVNSRIWSWSEKRRNEELDKCVPRCRDCHKIKSRLEHPKGSAVWSARITEAQVKVIREKYAGGVSQRALAVEFGIAQRSVSHIVRFETWKHV